MTPLPAFPTKLHRSAAESIGEYFSSRSWVDTVLVVNSCARGQAVPESDLDFAILLKRDTSPDEIKDLDADWQVHAETLPAIIAYRQSGSHALLHLDLITGEYFPGIMEAGGGPDLFEIEIGNQVGHSAPMGVPGVYFRALQAKWMPYYGEQLRLDRLTMTKNACAYDLDHIPLYIKRGLYFQAFDRLYVAFQKFLQALFIANKTYPISYNKWIKLQVANWLNLPDLYPKLSPIISVSNIESGEINDKAKMLRALLNELP